MSFVRWWVEIHCTESCQQ